MVGNILTDQPLIPEQPPLGEVEQSEQDLVKLNEKLQRLKETHVKTGRLIREVLVQLDDLEALERRTLEVLLAKLERA